MFFQSLPPELVRPVDQLLVRSLDQTCWSRNSDSFDVLRRELQLLHFGHSIYRLRSTLVANYYPGIDGSTGRLVTTPAFKDCVGQGETFDSALNDWIEQFHVRFQSLLAMRPWEMSDYEREEWENIEQVVEVAAYRRETPRRVRQIGVVSQSRRSATHSHQQPTFYQRRVAIPNQVLWESGRKEIIDLALVVADFASLRPGQRFEATVLRDPQTDKLLQIVDIVPLRGLPSASEARAVWDSLPCSEEVERVDWATYE